MRDTVLDLVSIGFVYSFGPMHRVAASLPKSHVRAKVHLDRSACGTAASSSRGGHSGR